MATQRIIRTVPRDSSVTREQVAAVMKEIIEARVARTGKTRTRKTAKRK
jgi:hypothetical protein